MKVSEKYNLIFPVLPSDFLITSNADKGMSSQDSPGQIKKNSF